MAMSLAQQMRQLTPEQIDAAIRTMAQHAKTDVNTLAAGLVHDWGFWGRPEQHAPAGDWTFWLVMTGRRWGKTRTAAEWLHERVEKMPRTAGSVGGLLQRTAADLRDIMVEGPSGILATAKPGKPVTYEPSKRQVTFHNGYTMKCYTAEEPDMLRGPTLSTGWADEFGSLKAVTGIDGLTAFDNFRVALSAPVPGDRPRAIITTTPRRVKSVKDILAEAKKEPGRFVVTAGTMMDNIDNLDAATVRGLISRYAGTALGAQELDGELITDVEGASFKSKWFEATRIPSVEECPEFGVICVAVDPSSGDGTGDECGISVVAISAGTLPTVYDHKGLTVVEDKRHLYVLEDASVAGTPDQWAAAVSAAAERWHTTTVVAEGNQGGQMVSSVIRNVNKALRVKIVHARVNKNARAEPVAALFAQGRAHLVGEMPLMEDQATTFKPGDKDSPDRADAMVWGVTFLEPSIGKGDSKVKVSRAALATQIG